MVGIDIEEKKKKKKKKLSDGIRARTCSLLGRKMKREGEGEGEGEGVYRYNLLHLLLRT